MPKLTLLIGMPGSGKTTFGLELAEKSKALFFDDFSKLHKLSELDEVAADVVIADVKFCEDSLLQSALHKFKTILPRHDIELVYFKNDPVRCYTNVQYRNDGRKVNGTIARLTKIYNPPETAREIWNATD